MRQVTDGSQNLVVELWIHREHDRPRLLPEGLDLFERLRVRLLSRRQNAASPAEEVFGSRRRTRLFLSGDRMPTDEMHAGRHLAFRPYDQLSFDAADVGDNGAGAQTGGPLVQMAFIRIDRRREDDEVRVFYRLFRIHDV